MTSKYVKQTKHPDKDLCLECYTKKAFYKKAWNDATINARGHVYDGNGQLVSCPFKKIFNIDEHPSTEFNHVLSLVASHWDEAIEFKKWNGHLGIMFEHDGSWINTTKGSFEHDFVDLDRIVIRQSGYTDEVLEHFPENWTLLFEIVADYDSHLLTDSHIKEIGDECAVLIGVNDRTTRASVDSYRRKIMSIFDSLNEPRPFIPVGKNVCDDTYLEGISNGDLSDNERMKMAKDYIDSIKAREGTEGAVLFIPSLDYRVKIKTPWFLKHRYINQFNAERTRNIFNTYEDSEEAFRRIPEELHDHYQEVINDYFKFVGMYKENLMTAFESICKAYKTRPELDEYINTCEELGDLERKAMKAFITNHNLYPCIKDVFMVKYKSFSLVDRIK